MRWILLACLMLCSSPLWAQSRPASAQMVFGTLVAVDLKVGTLQAATRHGRETFNLYSTDIAVLTEDGPLCKIKDVPVGTRVLLRISGADDIVAIHVVAPVRRVLIEKIDLTSNTLIVQNGPRGGQETLAVQPNVRVFVDGLVKSITDVPLGKPVQLRLSADIKTVLSIDAATVKRTKASDSRKNEGVVLDFDCTRNVVKVRVEQQEESFSIAPHAVISLVDGASNNVLSLVPGMKVTLTLDASPDRVVHIKAEPTFKGVLKSVDADKGTIVVVDEAEKSHTLKVDGKTTFRIHGWLSQLQDFPTGARIHVVHDADQRVRALWMLSAPR